MGYLALYRAWRPTCFGDIVGQESIVTTLVNQIETGHIAHAYLFCGSRGTGKTSTAKVFARAINCRAPKPDAEPCGTCEACIALANENNMDVIEIDAASNNGVDEIRDLRERIVYPPTVGRYKVYIIDEVHMLSIGAFNALLKTLEEPPAHAVFILATTEPQKLPATIVSRCQRFDFKRIRMEVIVDRLRRGLDEMRVGADAQALESIARAAEGGMRDAVSLLDMCLSYADGHVTDAIVRDVLGATDRTFLFEFAGRLIAGDAAAALTMIDRMVRDGRDPQVFAKDIVAHLRALLIAQFAGDALADLLEVTNEDAARFREQASQASREMLMRAMELFMRVEPDMKWSTQPRALVELTALRVCRPSKDADPDALILRVEELERALREGAAASPPPAKRASKKADAAQTGTAAAAPKPDTTAAEPRPDAADDTLWKRCIEKIQAEEKALYPLVAKAVLKRVDGDSVWVEYPKNLKMYVTILATESKRAIVEGILKELTGRPLALRVSAQGESGAAPAASGKAALAQAFDVFGRENVIVQDE